MWLKHLYITILLLSQCRNGDLLSPADRECEMINAEYYKYMTSNANYVGPGREVILGEFPYVVAIGSESPDGYMFGCAGTIVSAHCVVTAAHCVDIEDSDNNVIIRSGSIDVNNREMNSKTDYKVDEIFFYPEYDKNSLDHDIAVLCVDPPLNLSDTSFPICMESSDEDPEELVTIGWGPACKDDPNNLELRKATLEAVSRSDCDNSAGKYLKDELSDGITKDMICAEDPKKEKEECPGDTGGPLVKPALEGRSTVVGVVSFAPGCDSDYPGVFIRVSSYRDWIERIAWRDK